MKSEGSTNTFDHSNFKLLHDDARCMLHDRFSKLFNKLITAIRSHTSNIFSTTTIERNLQIVPCPFRQLKIARQSFAGERDTLRKEKCKQIQEPESPERKSEESSGPEYTPRQTDRSSYKTITSD